MSRGFLSSVCLLPAVLVSLFLVQSCSASTFLDDAILLRPHLVSLRRELHQLAELGFEEHKTSARLIKELEALGISHQSGIVGTGIVATLGSGQPVVALRADMDALPIQESLGLEYSSLLSLLSSSHLVHCLSSADILSKAISLSPWITQTRRDLHQTPESGASEFETHQRILSALESSGISHRSFDGKTGVVATLGSGLPVVALRADMDALPILEPVGIEFRSKNDGWMHACGHDAHTAMLLGAARLLKGMTRPTGSMPHGGDDSSSGFASHGFNGTVVFVFQPDEEVGAGGGVMVERGVLEGVQAAFALHVAPFLDSNYVATRAGTIMAGALSFAITITGRGGHAAMPHLNIDPIVTAAAVITALQTVVSRETSPLGSSVLSITMLRAGDAYNVIPDTVAVGGTIRALDHASMEQLRRRLEEVSHSIARAHGCSASVNWREGQQPYYPPTVNNPIMAALVRSTAGAMFGSGFVVEAEPLMAAEDFSFFCNAVPCAYSFLGIRNESAGSTAALHSPKFKMDESVLHRGAALLAGLAVDWLKANQVAVSAPSLSTDTPADATHAAPPSDRDEL
ncbi:MAG: hypothetical protein WDW38_006865 [Sanguina aurantia]